MDNMTTSKEPITEGQIGRFNEKIAARLRKKKGEIPSDVFQELLGDETLTDEVYAAIRKRVEARTGLIIHTVKVDRTRTPKKVLDATGRKQYTTDSVVKAMPKGEGEQVEVVFFKLNRYISDNDLDKEYELRGLVPADPYSLAAVNEADPAFADEYPNGTHWKDSDGNWCYASFSRWSDDRKVRVLSDDVGWSAYWFFAGLRKKN